MVTVFSGLLRGTIATPRSDIPNKILRRTNPLLLDLILTNGPESLINIKSQPPFEILTTLQQNVDFDCIHRHQTEVCVYKLQSNKAGTKLV